MQIIFCVAMLLFLVVATAIVLTDIKHSDEDMDYDRRDAVLLAFTNGHIEGGIEGGGE